MTFTEFRQFGSTCFNTIVRICLFIPGCTKQMDLAFVLDSSGSLERDFEISLRISHLVIYGVNFAGSRARVAAVTYSNTANQHFKLNKYTTKDGVLNAFAFMPDRGKTNTANGLKVVRSEVFVSSAGDRSGVPNIVLLFTDGRSNMNEKQTKVEASLLHSNARVLVVGLGKNPNNNEINDIASSPSNLNTFYIKDKKDVESIADSILKQIC